LKRRETQSATDVAVGSSSFRMDAGDQKKVPWSEKDVERLVRLVSQGVSLAEICRRMRRTRSDMEAELFFLCISPPSDPGLPRGRQ
jgi:hypothetical protein